MLCQRHNSVQLSAFCPLSALTLIKASRNSCKTALQFVALFGGPVAFGLLLKHAEQIDGVFGLFELHVGLVRHRVGHQPQSDGPLQVKRAHQEREIGRGQGNTGAG